MVWEYGVEVELVKCGSQIFVCYRHTWNWIFNPERIVSIGCYVVKIA